MLLESNIFYVSQGISALESTLHKEKSIIIVMNYVNSCLFEVSIIPRWLSITSSFAVTQKAISNFTWSLISWCLLLVCSVNNIKSHNMYQHKRTGYLFSKGYEQVPQKRSQWLYCVRVQIKTLQSCLLHMLYGFVIMLVSIIQKKLYQMKEMVDGRW